MALTLPHVRIHRTDRHYEVQRELVYNVRDHSHEHGQRCVLKVGQLDVQRAELNAPTDLAVGRGGTFEPHSVPACRLKVFEVGDVVGVELLREPVRDIFFYILLRGLVTPREGAGFNALHQSLEVELVFVGGDRVPLEEGHDVVGQTLGEPLLLHELDLLFVEGIGRVVVGILDELVV